LTRTGVHFAGKRSNPIYYVLLVVGRAVWTVLGDRLFDRRLAWLLIRLGWIFIFAMAIYTGARWIMIKSTL
jgi:hypothetical protein